MNVPGLMRTNFAPSVGLVKVSPLGGVTPDVFGCNVEAPMEV